ncbi:MAG: hypothetical protein IIX67_05620, partial [Clostridia bacterium]|nr:hypothetical protein [Clostridia bacterium]
MKDKLIKAANTFLRSLALITVNILITYAAYRFSRPNEYGGDTATIHLLIAAVLFVLSFYSFTKLITTYNAHARTEFVTAENKPSFFATAFKSPWFWCDILTFVAVAAIFDLELVFPFASDIAALYFVYGIDAKIYSL